MGECGRLVQLMRHGESVAQTQNFRIRQTDPSLLDCGLSPKGIKQAQKAHLTLDPNTAITLIVVSPLTRALMTARAVVEALPSHPTVVVHPDLQESATGLKGKESLGRAVRELERNGLCEGFDMSLVEERERERGGRWWVHQEEDEAEARITAFESWLSRQHHAERAVLIGHTNWFEALVNQKGGFVNACAVSYTFHGERRWTHAVSGSPSAHNGHHHRVQLRLSLAHNHRDVRVVVLDRAVGKDGVIAIARKKWRKANLSQAFVDQTRDLTDALMAGLADGTHITLT